MTEVGLEIGHDLDGRDSTPGRDKNFFRTPQHPDLSRGTSNLFSYCARESFLEEKAVGASSWPVTSI
jgi:hypothetical protein